MLGPVGFAIARTDRIAAAGETAGGRLRCHDRVIVMIRREADVSWIGRRQGDKMRRLSLAIVLATWAALAFAAATTV